MIISLEVSEKNEGTESPYWLILDPKQNMRTDVYQLAAQITGPFFSRESAQRHLEARRYAYSEKACVYCHSGYYSEQYKLACRAAAKAPPHGPDERSGG